jgi:hypothetical protein
MAQDWSSPAPSPAHLLRPLTTGEVLDNTFTLFRSRFWLFAGLASLSGAWQVVLQGLQLLAHHLMLLRYGLHAATIEAQISGGIDFVIMLPVAAVVYAASVYSLGEVYLGRPVTARQALTATRSRWLRYVGIALWQLWSAIWLPLVLLLPALLLMVFTLLLPGVSGLSTILRGIVGGLLFFLAIFGGGVYGVIAYIRNALAVPSAVVETTGVRASMRRSKFLAAGAKGRIFVVLLIAIALYMVAVTIESPLLFLVVRNPQGEHIVVQCVVLVVGFLAQTLVSPVVTIGLTLVYFDQRVRKEAFDLLMLLGPADPAPGLAEPIPAPEPILVAELPLDPADPIGDDGRF